MWHTEADKSFYVFDEQGHVICNADTQAHAALIAAAPTMLEALERIVAIKGSTGGAESLVREYRFIAEQALAKVNP